jgi:cytochrome P450
VYYCWIEENRHSVRKGRITLTAYHTPLGESFDPLHIQVETPYAFYAQARREEPITFNPALRAYLVSRYDDIRSILLHPALFSSKDALDFPVERHAQTITELRKGYPFAPATIASDGDRHTRLREPVLRALSPTRVRAMESFIRETSTRIINGFLNAGKAEVISQFAYPFPLEIILTILGIPRQDLEMVKKRSDAVQMLLNLPLSEEEQAECARQFVALQHYYAHLIEEKRVHPVEDLLSDIIRYGEAGEEPLSEGELISQITGIVIAGHETTTRLIGNGLVLLLEDPTRWQALCEHQEQIPQAIEEILRLRGPVQGFIRTTTQEVTVGGISMQPGTRLFVMHASGNRDEGQFSQADHFEIERRPNHHLAFGHGIHFCVGAALARLEGRIAFEELTQRIPRMRLLPDQQFTYTFNLTTYGYKRIYTQWD